MPFRFWKRLRRCALLLAALLCAAATSARACDTCGCTLVPPDETILQEGWQLGISEQFTAFDRLRLDSQPIDNPLHEHFESSITTLLLGYNFNDRIGLQADLPYVHRSFARVMEGMRQTGTVSGLGDATLLARYTLLHRKSARGSLILNVLGGLKLPTGSAGYLKEQMGAMDSAVGGHDLALGSGSVDEILHTSFYWRQDRFMANGSLRYSFRNTGSYGYRFADEFQWDVGPGYYLTFKPRSSLALQVDFNGTIKDTDRLARAPVVDTGVNQVYVGPRVTATWNGNSNAFLGVDLPIHQTNTDLQLVPSYRIRGGASFRF